MPGNRRRTHQTDEELSGDTMEPELITVLDSRYEEFLSDESKLRGKADTISFPKTKAEIISIINQMREHSVAITIQGGRTGICGGAVPENGHVLNLSGMNRVLGLQQIDAGYLLEVQAGFMLSELEKQVRLKSFDSQGWDEASLEALRQFKADRNFFWPPDPTEASATIGGILATNAQGICTYLYGESRQHLAEICLIDGHGEELTILRGEQTGANQLCNLPNDDLMDLHLGGEGLYGVIVSAVLRLIIKPSEIWGICFFFEAHDSVMKFAEELRSNPFNAGSAAIAAIEYFDRVTLDCIKELKQAATKLKDLPEVDNRYVGMIYVELHGEDEGGIESIAEKMMQLSAEHGCDDQSTWALSGENEIEKLKGFRHAAPESVNIRLEEARRSDSRITKLSTDITVSDKSFGDTVVAYRKDAENAGVDVAIFGHVAGSHVHVNILPRNHEDYLIGKMLIAKWTLDASDNGGLIFTEHGVGKIKKDLFQSVTRPEILEKFRCMKSAMDPEYILNRGNMFDA